MDLLGKPGDKSSINMKIRENESGEVFVDGAKTIPVTSVDEVFKLMEQVSKVRLGTFLQIESHFGTIVDSGLGFIGD